MNCGTLHYNEMKITTGGGGLTLNLDYSKMLDIANISNNDYLHCAGVLREDRKCG